MMQITELEVWKTSMEVAKTTYETSAGFPETGSGSLAAMMRTVATSIPANIAAAASRKHGREPLNNLQTAKGLIYELETQFYLAEKLGYIDEENLSATLELIDTSRRLLFGFIKYYQRSDGGGHQQWGGHQQDNRNNDNQEENQPDNNY